MLALSNSEIEILDAELEPRLEWAKIRTVEAEQLALDCARLLSCTEDRLNQIKGQGFFTRCWNSFSGKTGELERANTNDLIHMQKASLRFISLLQERQLMLAHSMLTLKNNLLTLAIAEAETRQLLVGLAENTLRRFQELEKRVDQLEISQNLQGWLLTLEDRDYEETYPTPYLRMFKIVNDFYTYKDDNWNYNDMLFMRKALRTVGINPKSQVSMNMFIEGLVDEIQSQGFEVFSKLVQDKAPVGIDNYGYFAIENVSSQVFTTVHGLHTQYTDKAGVIEELSEELAISQEAALKRILSRYVAKLNVDMDCQLPMSDIAAEILGSYRIVKKLNDMSLDIEQGSMIFEKTTTKYFSRDIEDESDEASETDENSDESSDFECTDQDIANAFGASGVDLIINENSSYFVKGVSEDYFSSKKLHAGRKSFGCYCDLDDVLFYYDETLFGGGDEGIIVTCQYLYFKNTFSDPDSFSLKSIRKVTSNSTRLIIETGSGVYEISCTSSECKKAIENALQTIRIYLM